MDGNILDIYKNKKRKISILYFSITLLFTIALLAGCIYDYSPENERFAAVQTDGLNDQSEEVPQRGGEIRVPLPFPGTMNPLLARTKSLSDFLGIIFEGLFKFGKDFNPVPLLAQSWEVKEHGRVWHIRIQEGVRFHDGLELTAEDVIFTFKALQGGILDSPYENGIFGNPDIETMIVDEDDPYALYVHLFEPINNLTKLLTFPVLPRHVYQTDVLMADNKSNLSIVPIGTGPYKADEADWDSTVSLRLIRNDDWWGGEPLIDSVRGIIFEDKSLARSAFINKKTDIFDSSDINANVQAMGGNVQKLSYMTPNYEFIGLNLNHPFLSDVLVRRAIAHALDKRHIISTVYNNAAQDTESPIPPVSWLYRSGHGVFDKDIYKAANLLEEAGFIGIDDNGMRYKETETGPQLLKLRLLTNVESGLRRHTLELISSQLETVGILVDIQMLPNEQFVIALREKDYDMALMGSYVGKYTDANFDIFLSADEQPLNLYSSQELNNLLNEAKRAYQQEKLKEVYGRLQEYINNMLPVISLYFRTSSVFFDMQIKGIEVPLTSEIYNGIEKWYFTHPE